MITTVIPPPNAGNINPGQTDIPSRRSASYGLGNTVILMCSPWLHHQKLAQYISHCQFKKSTIQQT